ncbi:MAG: hypothetical protein IJJ38_02685 [Lachnospiraceae bacterium]|nr:hypothetical protein [Lachnospiraceae bacterium]
MAQMKHVVKALLFSTALAASVYASFGEVQTVRAAASPEKTADAAESTSAVSGAENDKSGKTAAAAGKKDTAKSDPDEGLLVIGKKAEGETIHRIVWTNRTGRGIAGVQIKNIYDAEYPDSLMPEGKVLADGETAVLYFDASDKEEKPADASGKEKKPEFNIRVTFEDGKKKDMTSYPYAEMDEAELFFDEDLLHAVYISLETGEEKDTSGREKALRNETQRAKEEAAAAAAAARSSGSGRSRRSSGRKSSGGNSGGANECIGEGALLW